MIGPVPPRPSGPSSRRSALDAIYWCFLALCGALILLACLARFSISSMWDDSYISVRYADNFLRSGAISWNPGGPPTYGLTAPFQLLVLVPVRWVASASPALAGTSSSLVSGFIWLLLMFRLVVPLSGGSSRRERLLIGFLLLSIAVSIDRLADHLTSGMDTTFAMAYATVYLLLLGWHERTGSRSSGAWVGTWGGLAFFARPDLVIYTVTVPAIMVLLAREPAARRRALAVLGLTFAVLSGAVLAAAAYFDSPLPLPAYVKGLLPYQANRYAGLTRMEFRSYVLSHWHLFVLIAFGIALGPREWWRRVSSTEKGILLGTAFFLYYHYRFVLPVMGYSQRFNYPTLPALIYLGAVGLLRLVDFVGRQDRPGLRETRRRLLFWGSVGLSICLLGRVAWSEWTSWLPGVKGTFGRFVWTESPEADQMDYVWPSLAAVARLPDSLVIAATEVGLVGALNPGKQVIDLAGLNETAVAHNLIEGAALLRERHPDLIYMPHPDHQKLLRDIALDPYLQAHYDFFSWPTSFLGVAVWRDSPHYARMRAILTRRSAPRHAPPDSGTLSGAGELMGGPGLEQGR